MTSAPVSTRRLSIIRPPGFEATLPHNGSVFAAPASAHRKDRAALNTCRIDSAASQVWTTPAPRSVHRPNPSPFTLKCHLQVEMRHRLGMAVLCVFLVACNLL